MAEKKKQTKKSKEEGRKVEEKIKLKNLKKQGDKKKPSKKDTLHQIATRAKLERDYVEDTLYVTFSTSPETKRTVIARRPTHVEMVTLMKLSTQAANAEGQTDPQSLEKMVEVYNSLPKLAAKLCVDKSLDEDFWTNNVSFGTLQNFITTLITATQQGVGPNTVSGEDLQSFRGK